MNLLAFLFCYCYASPTLNAHNVNVSSCAIFAAFDPNSFFGGGFFLISLDCWFAFFYICIDLYVCMWIFTEFSDIKKKCLLLWLFLMAFFQHRRHSRRRRHCWYFYFYSKMYTQYTQIRSLAVVFLCVYFRRGTHCDNTSAKY